MPIETGTFISDLVATNPTSSDPKAEGDDHIRLVKSTVKATFPNITGAVTPTHTELNRVAGVTSAIQTQLNSKAPLASPTLTGVPTAPTAPPGTPTNQIATCEFVVSQALSATLPGQLGQAGKFLTTDGTDASWAGVPGGVQSVGLSVPSFLSVANSPITGSGTLAVSYSGTALPVLYGGTGVTTSTGSGANVLGTSPSISGPTLSGAVDVTGSQRGGITAVSALAIDCSLGNYFTKTINANSTFTITNAPASRAYSFTLELTHTSGTVTWPTSVQWPGGTAPTLTTGKTHLFMFVTDDAGTRWRGAALADYTN